MPFAEWLPSAHCTSNFNQLFNVNIFKSKVSPGPNEIRRRSDQSSVTIPYERSFRRIGSKFQPSDEEDLAQFRFCGCGWPQHMLVPKGTAEGSRFDVFVMISNYADDRIDQTPNLYASIRNPSKHTLNKLNFQFGIFFFFF